MGYKLLSPLNSKNIKDPKKIKEKIKKHAMNKRELGIYSKRPKIENHFGHIKQYPKIGSIYERKFASYEGLVKLINIFCIFCALDKLIG